MTASPDDRRSLLSAALRFALLGAPLVRGWLDTWTGIGLIAAGMARQGYDLALTRYDERGWRATFYVTGVEHSATGATASAFEATPWRAAQRAAWETLRRVA